MILQCRQCRYRYYVPDTAIAPPGRTVRCANCKHSWFEGAKTPEQALADMEQLLEDINRAPKPEARPLAPGANLPVHRRKTVSPGLRYGVIAAAIATLLLSIFSAWPGLFGQPPSIGLALVEVALSKLETDDEKKPRYAISGKIINTSDAPLPLPVLRITLVDKEGNTLQPWEDRSAKGTLLQPGEEMPFNFDALEPRFTRGTRFVLDLGSPLELALRRRPQ